MSNWHTLLVKCFSVHSPEGAEEFSGFDEACAYLEKMREQYPCADVEISAEIDA